EPYFALLVPTSYHFAPHLKRVANLVKRNRAITPIFFPEKFAARPGVFSATCCAQFRCQSPHFVAMFSLLLRRTFSHSFLGCPASRTISVLHLSRLVLSCNASTKPKELDPWNGPHLGTKKLT